MMNRILVLGMILLCAALSLWADYDDGRQAWEANRYAEALSEWQAAADEGDSQAMLALGRLYLKGLGAPQDYVLAHMWFNLAASRGEEDAAEERDALSEKMAPAERAEAQKRAREWRPGDSESVPPAKTEPNDENEPAPVAATAAVPPPPPRAIREAQSLLAALGYEPGSADGAWNEGTGRAYQAFLRDAGLAAVDILTPDALREMRAIAEQSARAFAAHAFSFRAAAVEGDEVLVDVLSSIPGAGRDAAQPILWRPFFENVMVWLGRVHSAAPLAAYYNPLLDVAVITQWGHRDGRFGVVLIRALPGERLGIPDADVALHPPWMTAEEGLVPALARMTASRMDTLRAAYPADARILGRDPVTFAAAAEDLRAALSRLVWNATRRTIWGSGAEPWLSVTLAEIETTLATRDAATIVGSAPDTDTASAETLASLPAKFISGLALDMVVDTGPERVLIGSLPEDGDVYVFIVCRLEGDVCSLRRFILISLAR